jgi:hypothetical protein
MRRPGVEVCAEFVSLYPVKVATIHQVGYLTLVGQFLTSESDIV